ncbi:alpha-2,8-polysialyltransferase family protein [Streptomyces sp. NBC_00536]|uniref:polysialyltransferase family glycosyltransferase n=1 Tax=Streptomyces sp. NBC_00536 TaxID=2975769 RepID=UPI002E7FF169|nr:polysialyltransferase family glycosyltransferase [Streptomyces sp. NBC_00536]WUC80820.1 alpha-2,8-polysialyltransferase family protein [Streptomyces sp. NBC_00536]
MTTTAPDGLTQIFLASTLYGTATLAAALDAGACDPAEGGSVHRILLTSNNAPIPEVAPALSSMPGFDALRTRFDEVIDWNETIAPFHPGAWTPRPEDAPLWERQLRALWGLGDDRIELYVESIQVAPAQALCRLFPGAAIEVYADGLMSYGPTRFRLDPQLGMRVRRVLHLDLVPGLEPLLLTEFGVPAQTIPTAAFLKVLAELPPPDAVQHAEPPALLLGQYLSALDLLTATEEEELHAAMVRGAYDRGHRRLLFKPHPGAPAGYSRRAEEEAARLGVPLHVLPPTLLAETLYTHLRPALVVGCFSTALLTAATFHHLPVARTGTEQLLARLTPYQNSNRIPLTLVDALIPDLAPRSTPAPPSPASPLTAVADLPTLPALVTAVGFTMQPKVLAARRPEAEAYLASHLTPYTWRYFTRRRLTSLALPGGIPARLTFLAANPHLRRLRRALIRYTR